MTTWTRKLFTPIILLLGLVIAWQTFEYHDFANTPLLVDDNGQYIIVSPGKSVKAVARDLHKQGILQKPRWLGWIARIQGKAESIQAGEYRIEAGITPQQLLDMMVAGKVVQYSFTIVEGWNVRQVLNALAENEFLEHTIVADSAESIMPAIGIDIPHGEGWFLPDTYFFVRGTPDKKILLRAHSAMLNQLHNSWESRADGLPYKDGYEALVMASIVEKETAVAEERNEIAGVFVRRLQKGMLLQTDPTVIYGIGEKYDGNIRRKDLRTDTPYNTYTRKGLPPTPIAMPGAAAIEAALHPADGSALYFVSRGDGSHAFADTLNEHNQNVIKYQLNGRKQPFSSNPEEKNKKSGT